jgi:hypothetical protein
MKILLPLAALLAVGGCGSQEEAPTEPPRADLSTAETIGDNETLPPPRREEFTAAWAQACPDAEPVSTALCKSKGLGDPGFTCDFGLGEDEYRRHTAELLPGDKEWTLVDPDNACSLG